jgi:hypothetical protein
VPTTPEGTRLDVRDILVDGIQQLSDWTDDSLKDLTTEQVNWLPQGNTLSAGFHAWHISRTCDNVVNFVLSQKPPIWLEKGYMEKFALPKAAQGTGMSLEDARNIKISDPALLREYCHEAFALTMDYVKACPEEKMTEVFLLKPLGEVPVWRVFRQVLMTHGFMHLGEINTNRGMMGKGFSM